MWYLIKNGGKFFTYAWNVLDLVIIGCFLYYGWTRNTTWDMALAET